MISRSPFEHIHTIIDSRMLGNPNGFCPNDSFIVAALRLKASLEFVGKLSRSRRKHAEQGEEETNG